MNEGRINIGTGIYSDSGCELFDVCCDCLLRKCADEWHISPRARRALEEMAGMLKRYFPALVVCRNCEEKDQEVI